MKRKKKSTKNKKTQKRKKPKTLKTLARAKKKVRKATKRRAKKTTTSKSRSKKSTLRQSKTENFLENIRKNNSMIEYITNLRVMNPAANRSAPPSEKREGGFVRLAHAREEFPAPILNKGKAFEARQREEAEKATINDKKTVSIDDKD